jgi:hypothetical protein
MRYFLYLIMSCIAGFIGLFTFADQETFDKVSSKIVGINTLFSSSSKVNPIAEVERIAKLIIEDRNWNSRRINLFVYHWGGLDTLHQRQAKNSEWYRQFASLLRNKIKRPKGKRSSQAPNRDENKDLIFTLAVVVGVTQQYANYNNRTNLSRVSSVTKTNDDPEDIIQEEVASKSSGDFFDGNSNTDSVDKNNANEERPLVVAKVDTSSKFKPSRLSTTRSKPPVSKIKETDIDDVLDSYSSAYKSGDADDLIDLFASKGSGTENSKIRKLKANFLQQFKGSNERFVEFSDLYWQFDASSALGKGDYFAINELKNKKGTRTFDGKVNIELKRDGNKVRIAKFQLLNLKVKVTPPEMSLSSTKSTKKRKSVRSKSVPTAAELYEVVNRYVGAYEEGDIGTLESLFTYDAKTNSQSDLQGIKQNFTTEFSITADRQLFIQDLRWSFEDDYAKGIGNVKSLVLSNRGNEVESSSGKIQFIAKKINDKVYITHLYRTEHKN